MLDDSNVKINFSIVGLSHAAALGYCILTRTGILNVIFLFCKGAPGKNGERGPGGPPGTPVSFINILFYNIIMT